MGCFYRTANQHTEFGIFIQQKEAMKSKGLYAAECCDDSFDIICKDHENLEQRLDHLMRSRNCMNQVTPQDTLTRQVAPQDTQNIKFKTNTPQLVDLEKAQFQNKHSNYAGRVSKCKSTNHRKNFLKVPADENQRNMNAAARVIGWSLSYVNSCLSTMQNTKNSVSVPKLYPVNKSLQNINNCIRTFCRNEYTQNRNICCQRSSRHYNQDSSHYHITTTTTTTTTTDRTADDAAKQQLSSSHPYTSTAAALNCLSYNNYNIIRNSINFYTASSVILVLCYLTTTTTATTTNSETTQLDKHPIKGIDWTKFDETSSDKEILDLLLEKKRYDKRLLPPVNDEDFCCGLQSPDMAKIHQAKKLQKRGTLTVNVNVLLLSLASPDESSLKYEVEFLLNQQWADPRLQYGNKSHYDFLNALHHHDHIWTPDTYFIMHGDFKDPIIPMHFALRIYRNGTITYAMRRHLILSCQGSLHIFPFDDPKCSFSMESISYEEAQIKYVWKNDEDTLRKSPSLTTLNAYLIKNQTTACDLNSWRGNYSCLRVDLIFTRDRAFYFTTVFIPGIILVTSSFITFWLEWNAVPARSMIGVTTMLNFFTTSNGFRSTLPVVSNLTAMNVWDGVCMCFIYASLLEFVCVNYFGRKTPKRDAVYRPGENVVTQHLPAVLNRIGVILASPLGLIEREFQAATEKPVHERKSMGRDNPRTAAAAGHENPETITTIPFMDINVTKEDDFSRLKSTATNTPPLILRGESVQVEIHQQTDLGPSTSSSVHGQPNEQSNLKQRLPLQSADPNKSRSTSPVKPGEKRRDGVTNEIVACTICGGLGSPCTHSAKNGCAPESCFVQVRKREPHHPIRVAKTIDVIARITFPTAYAIFLIFFFVHYKGFS